MEFLLRGRQAGDVREPSSTPVSTAGERASAFRCIVRRAAGGALILASAVVVSACGSDHGALAQDFISKVVAGDASAAQMLASPGALPEVVSQIGLAGWPKSVTFSASNVKVDKGKVDGAPTTVTFLLEAKRGDRAIATSTATVTTPFVKTDGGERLDGSAISVSGALPAPDPALLFKEGTSEADARVLLDDFKSGAAWLGGAVSVGPRSTVEPIRLDAVTDTDPKRLTSYHEQVAQAVDGEETTWFVDVAAPGAAAASYPAASAVTKQATPAHYVDGTIDPKTLQNDAHAVSIAFRDVLARGDSDSAKALMLDPTAIDVTTAGWERMRNADWIATASDTPDGVKIDGEVAPFTATDGEVALKQAADGTWKVDALNTRMVVDVRPASGTYRYTNDQPLIGYGGDTVEVKLSDVVIRHSAQGYAALAEFSLHSLDKCTSWGCDMYATDGFVTATAAWKGNAAGTSVASEKMQGSTALGADNPGLIIVDGVGLDNLPLTITVTKFGNQDVGKGWVFKSK